MVLNGAHGLGFKKEDLNLDGKAIDNVIIERFFRSLKYEEIYINPCDTVTELKSQINNYESFSLFLP